MIAPWIIKKIEELERRKREERERPVIQPEIGPPPDESDPTTPIQDPDNPRDGTKRGVIIIGPDGEEKKQFIRSNIYWGGFFCQFDTETEKCYTVFKFIN